MSLLAAAGESYEAPTVADFWQPLFGTGAYAVTRPALVLLLSALAIGLVLMQATRRLAMVPGRGQQVTESLYGLVRNSVARDVIGSRDFLKFVPMLFTFFVLVLVNNLFGVMPFIQYPSFARVALPVALTLFIFVLYVYLGMRRQGVVGYFKHLVPSGLPGWLVPLIFFLEVLTYFFTRPVTLALRLFGNMFAGHLLILLFVTGAEFLLFETDGFGLKIAGGFSFVMAFVMTIFELLVQFLQAYIFTLLSALYIADALVDEH